MLRKTSNISKVLLVFINFSACLETNAQTIKLAFKQFVYSTYSPDSTGNNVQIDDYYRIDGKGTVHYISNTSPLGVRDSTYIAPDKIIIAINQIVNAKKA